MKKINFKLYIIWFLLFWLWLLSYKLTKWVHNYFTTVFIWVAASIFFINTSSIFFYKTLNSKDEYLKYIFSFLHILVLILISFLTKL